jgi:hypothetical protein
MQRSQLEHLIRAAAEITNQYEFVVSGSQSIVGAINIPPATWTRRGYPRPAALLPLGGGVLRLAAQAAR